MYLLRFLLFVFCCLLLLIVNSTTFAHDLNTIHGAYYSTTSFFDYSDTAGLPGETTYYILPQYHYLFLFSNVRLQNVSNSKWKFVSKMNEKIVQSQTLDSDYRLRNLYLENTEAIAKNWYVAGGRMPADTFWPLRRQDGGKIAYAFNKNTLIGMRAGSIPKEESSYINLDEPKSTSSIFYKKTNDKGDYLECAIGSFFEKQGKTLYRLNAKWNKNYSLQKHDGYFRAGGIVRAPENIFESVYMENGIYQNIAILHYLSVYYDRNIFILNDNSPNSKLQYEDIMSTSAMYGLSYFPKNSLWRTNFTSGINVSENIFGYLTKLSLFHRKTFFKDGIWDIQLQGQKIGYFDRKSIGTGYSIMPFSLFTWRSNIAIQMIDFRKTKTIAFILGQTFSGDYSSGLSWQSNLSIMNYTQGNVEFYIDAFLIHYFYKEYKPKLETSTY